MEAARCRFLLNIVSLVNSNRKAFRDTTARAQKCPRPGPKPPSRIHYSNQTDHPKHPPPAPLRLGRLPQVPKTALCLVVQLEVAWLASIEADTARSS